jgi:hypothetical protein
MKRKAMYTEPDHRPLVAWEKGTGGNAYGNG